MNTDIMKILKISVVYDLIRWKYIFSWKIILFISVQLNKNLRSNNSIKGKIIDRSPLALKRIPIDP
jgi:hypothetical protein